MLFGKGAFTFGFLQKEQKGGAVLVPSAHKAPLSWP